MGGWGRGGGEPLTRHAASTPEILVGVCRRRFPSRGAHAVVADGNLEPHLRVCALGHACAPVGHLAGMRGHPRVSGLGVGVRRRQVQAFSRCRSSAWSHQVLARAGPLRRKGEGGASWDGARRSGRGGAEPGEADADGAEGGS